MPVEPASRGEDQRRNLSRSKPGLLRTVGSHLLLLNFRVLAAVACQLPPRAWHLIAAAASPFIWVIARKHRHRTLENLRAWGKTEAEARRIGKASFRSNALVFVESLCMQRILQRKRGIVVEKTISPRAQDVIDRLHRGEVHFIQAVSGHIGVWEFMGAELASEVKPAVTVVSARLPKNPIFAKYLRQIREGFGLILVEKSSFMQYILRHVRDTEPRLHVFLCDQHFKGGLATPFLGRSACTASVPAILLRRYGVPTLVGGCQRVSPGHYRIEVDALDPETYRSMPPKKAMFAITADINGLVGALVDRTPEQWTWGHRRWRACCQVSEDSEGVESKTPVTAEPAPTPSGVGQP